MIKSMTAFAHLECKHEFGSLTWEIRSVNHRYLDISTRLPEDLRSLEQATRDKVAEKIKRGKLDCTLRYKADAAVQTEILINHDYARAVIKAGEELAGMLASAAPIRPLEILRWPGVMKEPDKDFTPVEAAALTQLETALEDLIATRQREGQRTAELLERRCEEIAALVKQVRERRVDVLAAIRNKMATKLADLQVKVDQDRLEQELVMIAQRMDVEEELERLETHIKEVRQVLKKKAPAGRRLDFLMQELNREANTLGSKSADSATTQASVDLKVLIEQMREQIQNIE